MPVDIDELKRLIAKHERLRYVAENTWVRDDRIAAFNLALDAEYALSSYLCNHAVEILDELTTCRNATHGPQGVSA